MKIDFAKSGGLVPVIIQDEQSLEVLMLGYMNDEAWQKTLAENRVTFFSRSKNRLWTKGEESGNFFTLKSYFLDCDKDTLLLKVSPVGPACHRGTRTCFDTELEQNFLFELERIIQNRYDNPSEDSYVNKLRKKGLNKIAQKVGEEATETIIAALNESKENLIDESSDLVFHLLVLLREKGLNLADIGKNLEKRHQ